MSGSFRGTRSHSGRSGFTIVELMVVIGVVLFLMTILVVVAGRVMSNAKEAATKGTIRAVDSLLTKRMEAFTRALKEQDDLRPSPGIPQYAQPYLSAAGNSRELARVLGRKALFRRHFPQRFSEMDNPPSYDTSKHRPETESAACLYHMLTSMPAFGAEAPDSDVFGSGQVADTDGDGLQEFIDGWGKPLRFYRWPTRLVRPELTSGNEGDRQSVTISNMSDPHDQWQYGRPINPDYDTSIGAGLGTLLGGLPPVSVTRGAAARFEHEHQDPLARDADDPLGLIHSAIISSASTASQRAGDFESSYHTPDTDHTVLIVSLGQDGLLGILEPNDTAKFGHLAQPDLSNLAALVDNITNRNVRAGGN